MNEAIRVDDRLSKILARQDDMVPLADSSGKLIGFFDPITIAPPGIARQLSPYSDSEIAELRKQKGGSSFEEVLAGLEKLQ